MSLNPFNPREPKTADIGLLSGEDVLLLFPGAYTPCKGEPFFTDQNVIVPVEPFYAAPKAHDAPVITTAGRMDREPPFYDQTDMAIATPCVSPYQWDDATGAALAASVRTIILDTVPDADATDEEKALPGYVANPGLLLSSRSMALFTDEPDIAITAIQAEWLCRITTAGDSDWTAIGSPDNNIGTEFTATGPGTGTGVATHVQGQYDDKNGVAFLRSFPIDRDEIAVTSTVDKKRYKITKVGSTTNWSSWGGPNPATAGAEFIANGAGSGTGMVTLAPLAHPLLRTGQTRYTFPETTLVGTAFTGDPFIPGEAGKFTSGNLSVCAYRYGYLLGTALWYIAVKIGRGTATWDKTAKTLTLACDTEDSTIYYSTDGSAPATEYTTPISITDTKTVRWYARKMNADATPVAMMLDSDEWQTYIEYQDEAPPDDFETVVFSSLDALRDNNAITIETQLQRAPTLFIAPSGTGDGDAPDDPGSATDIIGTGAANPKRGKARGVRTITAERSATPNTLTLTAGGADPVVSGSAGTAKRLYASPDASETAVTALSAGDYCIISTIGNTDWAVIGANGATIGTEFAATGAGTGTGKVLRFAWSAYSAPIAIGPALLLVRLDRQDDTPYTRDFRLPWFLGDITLRAVWDKDAATLTLSFDEATAANARYLSIWYGTGASADTLYTGPITVTETTTFRLMVMHAAEDIPYDFSTATDEWVLDEIDPTSTADFDDTEAATLTGTVPAQTFTQPVDLVWASEGTYSPAADPFLSGAAIIVRGGYNSDFTKRDVKVEKAIFPELSVTSGILDGLCLADLTQSLTASVIYNCHVEGTHDDSCGPWFTGTCYYCSADCECETTDPQISVTVISGVGYDCDLTVSVISGDGIVSETDSDSRLAFGSLVGGTIDGIVQSGDGYSWPSATPPPTFYCWGGYSYAKVSASCTGAIRGSITCSSGNGGNGNAYYDEGAGGGTTAEVILGSADAGSALTVDVQSGTGGDALISGAFDMGGGSLASLSVNATRTSTLTASVTAGDGGNGASSGAEAGVSYAKLISSVYHPESVAVTLAHGAQGTGIDRDNTGAEWQQPLSPTYLTLESCVVNGTDWGAGHYGHPDAYAHLSTDWRPWYSGAVNTGYPGSDGAPLAGYETPQGTGVKLGSYWE